MSKQEAMQHWANMEPDQDIMGVMKPLPYKAKGSTFGADSIRITGSPEFVDAVMSRMKDLLVGEAAMTRLALSRASVEAPDGKEFPNAARDAQSCYIQLHQRGRPKKVKS